MKIHNIICHALNASSICITVYSLDIENFFSVSRSRHHARSVSWLRRTEYISTEKTRFQPQTIEKVEAKVGFSIQKNFKV